ncbi:MAG: ABC transporter permease subunit [Syntrophaceae bacterium]|nr:ABC transporter permease subunit [Syntrophaceae bacterium]
MSLFRNIAESSLRILAWFSTLFVVLFLGVYFYFLFSRGVTSINPGLFFGETGPWSAMMGGAPVWDGIWPAVVGTVMLVVMASVLVIPAGIMAGVYISEYSSGYFREITNMAVDLLAGMPSIVMGLFGFTLILLLRKTIAPTANVGLALAATCLAILSLPYMIKTTQLALNSIDSVRRLTGLSLGFTRWQNMVHVLLPASSRQILNGVILTIGRSAEDTAVILLTGVVANAGIPDKLNDKFEALPFFIFFTASEHRTVEELNKGFGAAIVLLLVATGLFVCSKSIEKSFRKINR